MRQTGTRLRSARAFAVLGFLGIAVTGTALVVQQPWTWCPSDWSDAARVHLGASGGYVVLDGQEFQVGGNALLDYMPRLVTSPLDQARAGRHPLGVTASISASSRDALGDPAFTCFRVTRGSEAGHAVPRPTERRPGPMDTLRVRRRPFPITLGAWRPSTMVQSGRTAIASSWSSGRRSAVDIMSSFCLRSLS